MIARRARAIATAVLCGLLLALTPNGATAQGAPDGDADRGGSILAEKCLQCHADGMWRDQRQDRRAWEATLFRMVGRGAIWELDDIKAMAAYLGSTFGPDVPRAFAPARKQ